MATATSHKTAAESFLKLACSDVQRAYAEGDRGYALMHLFRFENGRIAELWDVAQEIPADSPNANGPF